jgi:hypothetical protein
MTSVSLPMHTPLYIAYHTRYIIIPWASQLGRCPVVFFGCLDLNYMWRYNVSFLYLSQSKKQYKVNASWRVLLLIHTVQLKL